MTNYFISTDGASQEGPLSREEVLRRVTAGEIGPDCLAWREGLADWTRISDLKEATPGGIAPPQPAPPVEIRVPSIVAPTIPPIQAGPLGAPRSGSGDGLAVASMVLGCVGLLASFGCGLISLPITLTGLIVGVVSKARGGMRVAGIVLNAVGLAISLGWVLLMIIGAATP